MTELERAKQVANAALLKLAEELGFASYRVNAKADEAVTWFPELAPVALAADQAIKAVHAARTAALAAHNNIRAAADRTAEAAQGQLRQS